MAHLPPAQRIYLDAIEKRPEWESINVADMRAQVASMLDRYAFPATSMARFLLELDQRLQRGQEDATKDEVDPDIALAVEVAVIRYELAVMACILTRKERGKSPMI